MAVQDRIIAGILLVHSTLGTLWTFWVGSHIGFPAMFIATNMALATMGLAAGVGWLRQRRWAAFLGSLFFLVQLVHVLTPTFQWSFTLGFNLNIALGWLRSGELGVNLFALVMLAWVSARAFARNKSGEDSPVNPSA